MLTHVMMLQPQGYVCHAVSIAHSKSRATNNCPHPKQRQKQTEYKSWVLWAWARLSQRRIELALQSVGQGGDSGRCVIVRLNYEKGAREDRIDYAQVGNSNCGGVSVEGYYLVPWHLGALVIPLCFSLPSHKRHPHASNMTSRWGYPGIGFHTDPESKNATPMISRILA